MINTPKVWEKVVEKRLNEEKDMLENQFGFKTGNPTIEPIVCVRQLIEKYLEKMRKLAMAFIDFRTLLGRLN